MQEFREEELDIFCKCFIPEIKATSKYENIIYFLKMLNYIAVSTFMREGF